MRVPDEIARTIVDPAAYADGRIDAAFRTLRAEAPVAKVEIAGYTPFWVVTRHADVMAAELRSGDFGSGDLPVTLTSDMAAGDGARPSFNGGPAPRSLVSMDGDEHRAMRRLTQNYFMPVNVKKLEGRIRALARRSVDHMIALGGTCDFARDVTLLYPLRVIMEILGIPDEDERLMLRLTQEMFGGEDKELNRQGGEVDRNAAAVGIRDAVAEFMTYFAAIIEDRKASPRDDLATIIANGRIDGAPIGFGEIVGYYLITATAGHDTTSNTTAMGMWALLDRPDLLREMLADHALIPGHVEESVRWASSVRHFMRGATADTELGGAAIAKGDWVMLSYLSANRDESVFEAPFSYDVRRPNKHVAFGYGPHVCLGQHLGRIEMRIFWEELLSRIRHIEFAGTPSLSATTFVGGPKRMPVRYEMA